SSHEIVNDRPARRVLADDLNLNAIEYFDLIRRKPHEIELVRWIRLRNGQVWQFDLIEIAIFHAPKHVPPCTVQLIDRYVFGLQPFAKTVEGRGRIANHRIVAAIFVVGLPRCNSRVRSKTPSQFPDDSFAFFSVESV